MRRKKNWRLMVGRKMKCSVSGKRRMGWRERVAGRRSGGKGRAKKPNPFSFSAGDRVTRRKKIATHILLIPNVVHQHFMFLPLPSPNPHPLQLPKASNRPFPFVLPARTPTAAQRNMPMQVRRFEESGEVGDGTAFVGCWRDGAEVLEGGDGVDLDLASGGAEEEGGGGKGEGERGDGLAVKLDDVQVRPARSESKEKHANLRLICPSSPLSILITSPAPPPPLALTFPFPAPLIFPFPFISAVRPPMPPSSSVPSSPQRRSYSLTAKTSFPDVAQKARSRVSKAMDVGGEGRW
jgi:hypothetical protein